MRGHLADIALALDNLRDGARGARESLQARVALLWGTSELHNARPSVEDEARGGLVYLPTVLWSVVPRLVDEMERAVEAHYGQRPTLPPPVVFRSWIGGDRDGNPKVLPPVTAWAQQFARVRGLAALRERARAPGARPLALRSAREAPRDAAPRDRRRAVGAGGSAHASERAVSLPLPRDGPEAARAPGRRRAAEVPRGARSARRSEDDHQRARPHRPRRARRPPRSDRWRCGRRSSGWIWSRSICARSRARTAPPSPS